MEYIIKVKDIIDKEEVMSICDVTNDNPVKIIPSSFTANVCDQQLPVLRSNPKIDFIEPNNVTPIPFGHAYYEINKSGKTI